MLNNLPNQTMAGSIKRHIVGSLALGFVATVAAAPAFADVPYDLSKFRPILDASKLQYPGSSPARIDYGEFEGEDVPGHFFVSNGNAMTFSVDSSGQRCEIRVEREWDTSDSNSMSARVKVLTSEVESDSFTFMQAHHVDGDGPMLRVYWTESKDGHDESIWAAYRTSPNGSVSHSHLIDHPGSVFIPVTISVQSNTMRVTINGSTELSVNVSSYQGEDMYWKAGVYNQDSNEATTHFSALSVN